MFRIIVDERKKREADPVLAMLRDAVAEAKKPGAADAYTRERLADMLQFFELMTELGRADAQAADAGGRPHGQGGRQDREDVRMIAACSSPPSGWCTGCTTSCSADRRATSRSCSRCPGLDGAAGESRCCRWSASCEVAIAAWVLSRRAPRACAAVQTVGAALDERRRADVRAASAAVARRTAPAQPGVPRARVDRGRLARTGAAARAAARGIRSRSTRTSATASR